ncbi:MAG: type I DNA topoisomerase [Deltaproteobacteria bacterium]|nr:MAG: type I DNA topoisomerase [Deltaproteobacteria bacterium]
MGKSLIVVESPAKARTIKKYVGKNFDVVASMGHVMDLPKHRLGVDVENGFTPKYILIKEKAKVVEEIRKKAEKADKVFLASDPDREGEAIAWHIADLIDEERKKVRRVLFTEITRKGVEEGMKNPRDLDRNLFEAQVARRVLDRLVGYKLSPLLWSKVQRGLSAGRVQSVALKLICDREREIREFVPEEYWSITGLFRGKLPPDFEGKLHQIDGKKAEIKTKEEAEEILVRLADETYVVRKIEKKTRRRNPPPPFITSTLQQEAWKKLRFTADRTMRVAQSLYEGVELEGGEVTGLITYMRTDSVRVSDEAISSVRKFIERNFGKEYLPQKARVFKNKKSAQDAHEAIRPTNLDYTPESVKGRLTRDQFRLYKLIYDRFVASQMAPARFEQTTVDIAAGSYIFRATGQVPIFDGYLKVYQEEKENNRDTEKEEGKGQIPPLSEGEEVKLLKLEPKQHFTQPPPRYTESSLIKKLEEEGVGRPSTYATIIRTIKDRRYVQVEEGKFVPTELGMIVSDLLTQSFPRIMDVKFTAQMEEELDKVEEGKLEWRKAVGEFYSPFVEDLERARVEMKKVKDELIATDIICEKCGGDMVIRTGRNGRFLACKNYPECKNTKNFEEDEEGNVRVIEDIPAGKECPLCGRELVIRRFRSGRYIACPGSPECKHTEPFSTGVVCPSCKQGELVEKVTRKGKLFYSCSRYPECSFATWNEPVQRKCPACGGEVMLRRVTKKKSYLVCADKECKGKVDDDG